MRKDVNDMFEINGRVTTAICYAKVIEDEAIEQIRRMCDYDLTRGSKVQIMPVSMREKVVQLGRP